MRPQMIRARAVLGLVLTVLVANSGAANPLPPETVACEMSGYAIARDRAGAAVRAEPDATSRIVGRLARAAAGDSAGQRGCAP